MVGAEFGGGGFVDGAFWDDDVFFVDVVGELVDFGFVNVADDGYAAAHVSIEGSVTDCHFAFIGGVEEDVAEFVGERH